MGCLFGDFHVCNVQVSFIYYLICCGVSPEMIMVYTNKSQATHILLSFHSHPCSLKFFLTLLFFLSFFLSFLILSLFFFDWGILKSCSLLTLFLWLVSMFLQTLHYYKTTTQTQNKLNKCQNTLNFTQKIYPHRSGAQKFNSDISQWDVSSVTDMSWMFL